MNRLKLCGLLRNINLLIALVARGQLEQVSVAVKIQKFCHVFYRLHLSVVISEAQMSLVGAKGLSLRANFFASHCGPRILFLPLSRGIVRGNLAFGAVSSV